MTDMVIGPATEIGGNRVEITTKGKFQITNPKGRIKTLSQDEFKKNLIKNADKINNGEDFEFKKDHKGLKIAAAAIGTAAVATAVIYRKEIGKYMKDFSFKKLWQDIKGLFSSAGEKIKNKKPSTTSNSVDLTSEASLAAKAKFMEENKITEDQFKLIEKIATQLKKGEKMSEADRTLLKGIATTKKACKTLYNKIIKIMTEAVSK